jgi:hypothetical protein
MREKEGSMHGGGGGGRRKNTEIEEEMERN